MRGAYLFMSFTLIQVGDIVYDKALEITGEVTEIDGTLAKIKRENSALVVSSLHNLIKLSMTKEDVLKIKIKYFNSDLTRITKIEQGDWIDLRAAETAEMKEGEFKLIPLGVGMKLPEGYEAIVAPRSSTFKNFGVVETNSVGVIDNSYSGNDDQWFFPAYALRDTTINFNDRICQFRIQKTMPKVEIEEVDELGSVSRGGHGSTGIL